MSTQNHDILIGIDGGGTGCRVAITTTQGQHLGSAKGGPANPTFDPQAAVSNILAALETARLDAKLSIDAIQQARAFAGLAGIRDDKIANFIASALPVQQTRVVEDRATTVTGALAGQNGAVAAIGTGSFLAHSAQGDTRYIGGWGFRLGDQASGAWLGHMLMRQLALCIEGVAPHTTLTRTALARFNGDTSAFFDFSNTASPADFGTLAPLVVEAATKGDLTATCLMHEGADYIVKTLNTLGYKPSDPLCLTGGLGPEYAAFLPPDLAANIISPKGSALDGALLLASRMAPLA